MIQKLCAGMPGRKTKSKKGFTLAELLIVVAIVAILVAIAIPVFSGSLERAGTVTDEANLRAAKAEASSYVLLKNGGATDADTSLKISDGDYYNYNTDTWGSDKSANGKSSANSKKAIKVTISGTVPNLTASVAWSD